MALVIRITRVFDNSISCNRTNGVDELAVDKIIVASQARLFRAVADLTARESHEEEELFTELLQRTTCNSGKSSSSSCNSHAVSDCAEEPGLQG